MEFSSLHYVLVGPHPHELYLAALRLGDSCDNDLLSAGDSYTRTCRSVRAIQHPEYDPKEA